MLQYNINGRNGIFGDQYSQSQIPQQTASLSTLTGGSPMMPMQQPQQQTGNLSQLQQPFDPSMTMFPGNFQQQGPVDWAKIIGQQGRSQNIGQQQSMFGMPY